MIFPPRGCHVTAYRPHLQPDRAGDADFLQLQEEAMWIQNSAGNMVKKSSYLYNYIPIKLLSIF
jgi:hypothetical protein